MDLQEILYEAIEAGDLTELEFVLEMPDGEVFPEEKNLKPLKRALQLGDHDIIAALVSDERVKNHTEFSHRLLYDNLINNGSEEDICEVIEEAEKEGEAIEVTNNEYTLMAKRGFSAAMSTMETKGMYGVDESYGNNAALHAAMSEGHKDVIEYLERKKNVQTIQGIMREGMSLVKEVEDEEKEEPLESADDIDNLYEDDDEEYIEEDERSAEMEEASPSSAAF